MCWYATARLHVFLSVWGMFFSEQFVIRLINTVLTNCDRIVRSFLTFVDTFFLAFSNQNNNENSFFDGASLESKRYDIRRISYL